ncbi:MAG: hypothetical protein ACLPUO_30155 [Streptosporangiaceae bacterium]
MDQTTAPSDLITCAKPGCGNTTTLGRVRLHRRLRPGLPDLLRSHRGGRRPRASVPTLVVTVLTGCLPPAGEHPAVARPVMNGWHA